MMGSARKLKLYLQHFVCNMILNLPFSVLQDGLEIIMYTGKALKAKS